MDVILKKAVEKLGEQGERVTVSNGYARNYLIPKGFAIQATKQNIDFSGNVPSGAINRPATRSALLVSPSGLHSVPGCPEPSQAPVLGPRYCHKLKCSHFLPRNGVPMDAK